MNITLYSNEAFVRFVLYCIIFGIASAFLYCVICAVFNFPAVCKCSNFQKFKSTVSDALHIRCGALEFVWFVIIAICLLLVSFIGNSGEFRVMSVPLFLLGFKTGTLFFDRIVISAELFCFYLLKRTAEFAFMPIRLLACFFYQMLKRVYKKAQDVSRAKNIAKYTKSGFKNLEKLKQNGLLEQWFEVV